MADISKIVLPKSSGGSETYYIKDAWAREQITGITGTVSGVMHYVGTTTTVITDGATTNPITVSNAQYTAAAGDVVVYGDLEFAWGADGKWHEFGSTGSLKALAFKDTASGTVEVPTSLTNVGVTFDNKTVTSTYTPSGNITAANHSGGGTATYTPAGNVTSGNLTGTQATISIKVTPSGGISSTSAGANGNNYKPKGTINTPAINKVGTGGTTTTIHNPTKATVAKTVVAAAPGATPPQNNVTYYSVDTSTETLSLYQLGYTTGDSITTSNVTVKTGDASYELAEDLTFTGTDANFTFSGTQGTFSTTYTPQGSVSGQTLQGTAVDFTFSGTEGTATGSVKPTATITQPTLVNTSKTVTVS